MDFLQNEEIKSKIDIILEKMSNLKTSFFSVLDDFKKHYVMYHKNPDYDEYERVYSENKNQLQMLQKDMFNINNSIQASTESISNVKSKIEKELEENKEKLSDLENIMGSLSQNNDGSGIMKDDFVILYNLQYLQNICIFLGVLTIVILFSVLFKDQISTVATTATAKATETVSSITNSDENNASQSALK
jgi:hypothetical protein